MSIKIKDLAKDIGVSADVIIEQLQKMYVDVDDDSGSIDDKLVGLVRMKLGVPEKPRTKTVKKPRKKLKDVKLSKKKEPAKKAKPEVPEKPEAVQEQDKPEQETEHPVKADKKSGLTVVGKVDIEPEEKEKKQETFGDENTEKDTEKEKHKKKGKKEKGSSGIEIVEKGEVRKPFVKRSKKDIKRPIIEIIEKEIGVNAGSGGRRKKGKHPKLKARPANMPQKPVERKAPQKMQVNVPVSIRELAPKLNLKPNVIMQHLVSKGVFVNINQELDEETVREVMENFGYILELPESIESIEKELVSEHHTEEKGTLQTRAPVVTFMGHVDHGKTSLLDYIRKTMVTKGEKGGITQHIGAYKVETQKGAVTFLDTPGHAAFTAMRARGANATDVVVLVVAADDGVMPQTKEAIDHARAAKVPIVVAINKCDLPAADPDRVKSELQVEGLVPEDWDGDTIMVEVSAETGEGVDTLVEMLMLESEMLELKASPDIKARGVVIESKKTPGQGVIATLLVQNGTLRPGDVVLCGHCYGRIKAMKSDRGERSDRAMPSTPVEVMGLIGVPAAGEEFFVVKDEKKAKTLSLLKTDETRKKKIGSGPRVTLEDFHASMAEGQVKELKIVLKADVQGSVEALKQSLEDLSTGEVKLDVIHSTVGNINESDVMLAMVTNAVIIGFHVKIDVKAEELAKNEQVDVRLYDIIYEAVADVRAAMEGLLEPEEKEVFQGRAQIKEVFTASKIGKVAGCAVLKGVIHRKDRIRVKRGAEVVCDGEINALKRFKDDVREVKEGFECGITIKNFNDIRTDDILEAYMVQKIARRLDKK